jgi:hypothetical protein
MLECCGGGRIGGFCEVTPTWHNCRSSFLASGSAAGRPSLSLQPSLKPGITGSTCQSHLDFSAVTKPYPGGDHLLWRVRYPEQHHDALRLLFKAALDVLLQERSDKSEQTSLRYLDLRLHRVRQLPPSKGVLTLISFKYLTGWTIAQRASICIGERAVHGIRAPEANSSLRRC